MPGKTPASGSASTAAMAAVLAPAVEFGKVLRWARVVRGCSGWKDQAGTHLSKVVRGQSLQLAAAGFVGMAAERR